MRIRWSEEEGPLTEPENRDRRIETLRELSAALLRVNASLDLTTVLQEVVDSARALTSARYGVVTTVDEAGQVQDFVSSGFTPEEHRQLAAWPDGPRLFEHFRDLDGPLRLADLPAFVRSLGFTCELISSKTFQGTPMRYRSAHVGNFFLVEKEGAAEFTAEDEDVLVLFAAQVATVIANARTHRAERRARADLEALVETSPVGVAVFEARTGHPVSLNREARRIVEGLRTAGRPAMELLQVITCRFADGREIALDADQYPVAASAARAWWASTSVVLTLEPRLRPASPGGASGSTPRGPSR